MNLNEIPIEIILPIVILFISSILYLLLLVIIALIINYRKAHKQKSKRCKGCYGLGYVHHPIFGLRKCSWCKDNQTYKDKEEDWLFPYV